MHIRWVFGTISPPHTSAHDFVVHTFFISLTSRLIVSNFSSFNASFNSILLRRSSVSLILYSSFATTFLSFSWERERERDSIIVFGGQIWPMRPKILHFTWYVWKWVAVSMFKNFTNECCNRKCTLWLWEKFVQRLGFVEDVWKAWLNMMKGRALYQSVIFRLSDLFRAKCA